MKKNRFAALCALLILTASVLFTRCEAGGNGGTQNEANTSKNTTAAATTTARTNNKNREPPNRTNTPPSSYQSRLPRVWRERGSAALGGGLGGHPPQPFSLVGSN